MTIIEKVAQLIEQQDLNVKEVALKAGIPPTTMYGWIKHNRDVPMKWLVPLCRVLNALPEELLDIEGMPLAHRLSADEQQLLELYRELDSDSRIIIKAKLVEEVRIHRAAKGA